MERLNLNSRVNKNSKVNALNPGKTENNVAPLECMACMCDDDERTSQDLKKDIAQIYSRAI